MNELGAALLSLFTVIVLTALIMTLKVILLNTLLQNENEMNTAETRRELFELLCRLVQLFFDLFSDKHF